MTNDFKKKILDWLSGNYSIGTGNNVPQFSNVDTSFNDLSNQLNTLFPYTYRIMGSLQALSINGNGLKYTIAYGWYYTTQSHTTQRGFILILDEDFDLLQSITQYSTGTNFGLFKKINVGDDGNFFAIEETSGGTLRFVMMNNIIAKLPTEQNYKVVLKKAYNLQGQSAEINAFDVLIKAPGQSRYIISGLKYYIDNLVLTELVINVGTSNEWNDYLYTCPVNTQYTIGDIYANWNSSGDLSFKIAGTFDDYGLSIERTKYAELTGSSNNVGTMTLTTYSPGFDEDLLMDYPSIAIINNNEAYIMIRIEEKGTTIDYLEIYHFKNGNLNQIYKKKTITTSLYPNPYSAPNLQKIGNEVFFVSQYITGTSPDETYTIEVGQIIDETIYTKTMYQSSSATAYMFFVVQKQFNLYNYYVQISSDVQKVSEVYSPSQYNGQPYQALNSMIPNSVELLSYQVPVFARELYNRIINNNTTTSIVNVPNSYVNDINITGENLYGETNSLLVEQNDIFTTNIYEELMINFVNTLLMRNENDLTNIIDNFVGATRVNKSISSLKDYDSCKISKYKINYMDGTNVIKVLSSGNVSFQSSKTQYLISFYNGEEKQIKNIQLISDDESTTYQTIDLRNLGVNKYYAITQDLKVV